MRPVTDPYAVAGFVAAEGTFTRKGSGFRFAVTVGAADQVSIDALSAFFGVGHTYWYERRKPHYDDEVVFTVQSLCELVEVIVPFMDEHLPPCHKRTQYEAWRADLLDYWQHKAKRQRTCNVDGCERIRRAKGLCRQHYFAAFGR